VLDTRLDTHLAQRSLAIPSEPRRHLEKIAASGARFDAFFIGHELPAGTVAKARAIGNSDDVGSLLGDPPVDRNAARAASAVRAALEGIKATAVLLGKTTAAGMAALADGALDPVVLGAVTADGKAAPGDLAALFHLVHWT
jgi:hypothetical protein